VTQPKSPARPIRIGGRAVHPWLLRERRRLSRRLVQLFAARIPQYGRLPGEALADDIEAVTEQNLVVIAESLRTRVVPTDVDLTGPITASAAHRAAEGIPLEALMAAYGLGLSEVWRALIDGAAPAELDDVLTCTEVVLGYLQNVTTAVSAAYLEERRRMESHEQDSRHALLSALLRGDPPHAPAVRAGIQLPERYAVLTVSLGRHADECDPDISVAIATRRKIHRVQRELDRHSGGQALSLLDTTGGTVLIPVPVARDDLWDDLRALVGRMSGATGVEVTASAAVATPDDVATAAGQAREVLDIVRAFARPPGLYRLTDLLVEYQLTRPSAATGPLKSLLDPLDDHPDLLTTLQTHLRHGLNRRRTATVLHLHSNTIDYRLRRVADLTGLDPGNPEHSQRISAALAARLTP
jgi:hypothetical protein